MILIACVDEKNGMLFHRRRQSQDRILRENLLEECKGRKLYMNSYSYAMFGENPGLVVSESYMEQAGEEDFCFMEDGRLEGRQEEVDKVILYQWNRRYPADTYFPLDLENGDWELERTEEFAGSSHEKITKEVYGRKG